ncbi:MAG: PmoA family protein [Chloroflexi bacterium]|nr:PmoA family protein [Chloroflexota bacterium]
MAATGSSPLLNLVETSSGLTVRLDTTPVLGYQDGRTGRKPYLHPLCAPDGTVLTDDAPADHPHHHGAWIAHHLVTCASGQWDFYLERGGEREGKQVQTTLVLLQTSGPRVAFQARHAWISPRGDTPVTAHWHVTVQLFSSAMLAVDWAIALATHEPCTFSPTNESALPLIRPIPALTARGGASMWNSRGQRNENQTFGRPAEWVAVSGTIANSAYGIALLDHPGNSYAPQPWFTRDYGPFGPHFSYFSEPLVVPPWRPLLLRYRLLLYGGSTEQAGIQEVWQNYAIASQLGIASLER